MDNVRFRPLLVPSLITLAMLAALVSLGTWQLHRRAWKAHLLADIDRAEHAAPVPLGADTPDRFTKISVSGTLRPGFALYGAEVRDDVPVSRLGAHMLEILDRAGQSSVLVDLGWVPADEHDVVRGVTGAVTLTGYIRPPDRPGWLSAADDPARRRFYTLDPRKIGTALGAPHLAPYTVIALGKPAANGPVPADALPRPPDNHLEYALTWFGLAITLLCIYASWVRGRLRR
jgi:surfeit locus 1 family protein